MTEICKHLHGIHTAGRICHGPILLRVIIYNIQYESYELTIKCLKFVTSTNLIMDGKCSNLNSNVQYTVHDLGTTWRIQKTQLHKFTLEIKDVFSNRNCAKQASKHIITPHHDIMQVSHRGTKFYYNDDQIQIVTTTTHDYIAQHNCFDLVLSVFKIVAVSNILTTIIKLIIFILY